MKSVISLSGAGKRFDGRQVLQDISAEVGAAEFVSILGPSGCGKSTLLRLIAGLVPFEQGHVRFGGADVTAPSPEMGFVFQTSNLLPWLNVRDNLLLGVDLDPQTQRPDEAAIAALVETLGLTGFEASYPSQLSGGMRHRVAIGQALARGPQVLLMDEPFGALDALTRDRLNMELLRIWQRDRKTVLLVTHSISEAVLLSDRVLVMSERPGTIIEDVRIDLPRPRDPSTTREDPAFGDYVVRLSKLMGVS
ncbi:MAG: ABC transporter ATP-binding protein [Sphingopyxis sp.]|uniref:ABC transporter ATP-binding protein n=1 Tax=Sphingopyxis sp. TaxID=1908224 RepID=UPI003D6CAB9F